MFLRRSASHRAKAARTRQFRAGVEGLEDRRVLSTIAALTDQAQLLRFDSESANVILGTATISGLQAGETVLGIDVRPATGELYGLGSTGRLYVIDPATGVATLRAVLAADPADTTNPFTTLAGNNFGIDFNPVPDRLRVVSDADQNLRINPVNGLVTTDTTLAFAAGDVNVGKDPSVVDAAYANNVAGATSTTLYGIDANFFSQKTLPDGSTVQSLTLVRQGANPANGTAGDPGNPNSGQLFSLGAFGRTGVTVAGFDISPPGGSSAGTAYVGVDALFEGTTARRSILVSVDLSTTPGSDTSRGLIGDGTARITDLAVLPSVQFAASQFAVSEGGGSVTINVTRTDGSVGAATVVFNTFDVGSAQAGSDYQATSGTLTFAAGETTKAITIPIIDDGDGEGDEVFGVSLGVTTGTVVLGGPSVVPVRINADDRADRTGPLITKVLETGPSRGITGAVIHFDEDLDPTRAVNLSNYSVTGIGPGLRRTNIPLSSAAYDPVLRTVTLTATAAFQQTQFRQIVFRIKGRGTTGVSDLAGNLLNGNRDRRPGGDAVFRFQVFSGTSLTFTDRDGDRATISIANGGRLDGIRPVGGPRSQNTQFWILDPIALRSTLSGTVRPRGDGIVVIAEIIGLDKKEFTPLLSNPRFRVNTLTFSSNATGIG